MNISKIRKIYPKLKTYTRNIKWRQLSDKELDLLAQEKQITSNCYDNSVRYVLINNPNGREIFRRCLKIQKDNYDLEPAYKASFFVNGERKNFRCGISDYYGKFLKYYADFYNGMKNFINTRQKRVTPEIGISILISKMIKKYPQQKPLWSRIYEFPYTKNRSYEHNKISNAFKWYTGRTPVSIGEEGINNNLKKYSQDVKNLLDSIDLEKDCFVVMTGNRKYKDIDSWHCTPIINIDSKNKTLTIINKRTNKTEKITYDELISNFKAICGIKDL